MFQIMSLCLIVLLVGCETPTEDSDTPPKLKGVVELENSDDHSLVQVQLLGSDRVASTDHNGNFAIVDIVPGSYDIRMDYDGDYYPYQEMGVAFELGADITRNVILEEMYRPTTTELASDHILNTEGFDPHALFYLIDSTYWFVDGYSHGILKSYSLRTGETEAHLTCRNLKLLTWDYTDGLWLKWWVDQSSIWYVSRFSTQEKDTVATYNMDDELFASFEYSFDPVSNSLLGRNLTSLKGYDFDTGEHFTKQLTVPYRSSTYTGVTLEKILCIPGDSLLVRMHLNAIIGTGFDILCVYSNVQAPVYVSAYRAPVSAPYTLDGLKFFKDELQLIDATDTFYRLYFQ